MISDVEDFFSKGCGRCKRFATPDCSARRWAEGLNALRRICHDAGLAETAKWGHPVYMHAGRNIAIIGAYLDNFRLGFFNAALLKDSAAVLEKSGANTRHPDIIRLTSAEAVARLEPVIAAYLKEAMGHAETGTKPPSESRELTLPDELADALAADPELSEAFTALTPGRQRSYVIALSSAKMSATRTARIAKLRDNILSGKGATER
jgi:uncharacterized protein YdeI (YjbR/CyaY-like superfamily)